MALSHLSNEGAARMVDVSEKPRIKRTARARGFIGLEPDTIALVRDGLVKKGDVLAAARIAGISAAKRTSELIPLCHNIEIDCVGVDFEISTRGVVVESQVVCTDKTGVEMEALTAVSVALLTIYDMCKAVDKKMTMGEIRLVEKVKQERATP